MILLNDNFPKCRVHILKNALRIVVLHIYWFTYELTINEPYRNGEITPIMDKLMFGSIR